MVAIDTPCKKCGRYTTFVFSPSEPETKFICQVCYDKYYSLEAIRDQKLKKILKKSLFKRFIDYIINIYKIIKR